MARSAPEDSMPTGDSVLQHPTCPSDHNVRRISVDRMPGLRDDFERHRWVAQPVAGEVVAGVERLVGGPEDVDRDVDGSQVPTELPLAIVADTAVDDLDRCCQQGVAFELGILAVPVRMLCQELFDARRVGDFGHDGGADGLRSDGIEIDRRIDQQVSVGECRVDRGRSHGNGAAEGVTDDQLPGPGARCHDIARIPIETVFARMRTGPVSAEIRSGRAVSGGRQGIADSPPHWCGRAEAMQQQDRGRVRAKPMHAEGHHGTMINPDRSHAPYAGTMRFIRRALGGLGLGWVLWRLFGPERQPSYVGSQERPLHVTGRTVLVGDQEFFVREAGSDSARPLLLIHGWGFDGEMNYYKVIPSLAERFRVIVPDHRNHGKSDRIRGPVEVEDLANEIVGMLDQLGYREVDILGYSLGGMAAQVIAHRHPDRVRRLILAGTAAFPVDRYRPAAMVGFWLARAVARLSKTEVVVLTYRFLLRSRIVERRHARWLWAAMLNRDPTLFYESGKAAWRFDARSWVGEIEAPVLVIIPTNDRVVPTRTQRELAALVNANRVVEVAGAGHESILSRPNEYVAAITAFLSGDV